MSKWKSKDINRVSSDEFDMHKNEHKDRKSAPNSPEIRKVK